MLRRANMCVMSPVLQIADTAQQARDQTSAKAGEVKDQAANKAGQVGG